MLRRFSYSRLSTAVATVRPFATAQSASTRAPSTTTTIRLSKLPSSTTETKLKEWITAASIDSRRILLEPGCAILFRNEAEADLASKSITSKFSGSRCAVKPTTMPSVLLQNLPDSASVQSLESAFASHKPKVVQIFGGSTFQATLKTSEAALQASKIIDMISIDGQFLRTHITKLPSSEFLLQVTNFPPCTSAETASKQLNEALKDLSPTSTITSSASPGTATIRYPSSSVASEVQAQVNAALQSSGLSSHSQILRITRIKKPCLFIRRITDPELVRSLLESRSVSKGSDPLPRPRRIHFRSSSKDVSAEEAIVYYDSEDAAFTALSHLRGVSAGGKKLAVSYRELVEPVAVVAGLPADATEKEVRVLFSAFDIHSIVLRPSAETGGSEAVVTMMNPKAVTLACAALSRKLFRGLASHVLKVTSGTEDGCDIGLELSVPTNQEMESKLWSAITGAPTAALSASLRSNRKAFVAFETTTDAVAAMESFIAGKTNIRNKNSDSQSETAVVAGKPSGGLVTSHISVLPSCALEVQALGTDVPVTQIDELLQALPESLALQPLRYERTAILKFKRHRQVVPALQALKPLMLDGQPISAEKYRPIIPMGDTAYDSVHSGIGGSIGEGDGVVGGGMDITEEAMDRFSLKAVLQDYMHTDPGLRWQIAKNAFERALVDAQALRDISFLLQSTVSPTIRDEAAAILKQGPNLNKANTDRLFELFLQRDDIQTFVADFREMEAFFGKPTESDPFDWSQFKIEDGDDIIRLQQEIQRLDAVGVDNLDPSAAAKAKKSAKRVPDGKIVLVDTEGESKVAVSLEDPSSLIDKDGRMWSGAILDTDMVQKTMPGNRVNTHRALVVVGNMRGAAGFGMGKGKTTADAVNSAFR